MKKTLATILVGGALAVGGGTIEMVSAPIDTSVAFKTVEWDTTDGELHADEYAYWKGSYIYRDKAIEEAEPVATTTDISKGKTLVGVRCEGCRAYRMGFDPLTQRWNRELVSVADYDVNVTTKNQTLAKTTAKRTLLESMGTVAEGAVAHGHSTPAEVAGGGALYTSLSFSHDATGDNYLVLGFNARPNISAITATFNSVAMTQAGSLTGGGDGLENGYIYTLANPDSGSYTVAISWTTSASMVAGATSYTGAYGNDGFFSNDCGNSGGSATTCTGTFTGVTSDDMVHGMLASDDYEISVACTTGTQRSESNDASGWGTQNTCTNTGTGSVNTAWTSAFGKVFVGMIVSGTPSYTPLNENIIYGTLNNAWIATSP